MVVHARFYFPSSGMIPRGGLSVIHSMNAKRPKNGHLQRVIANSRSLMDCSRSSRVSKFGISSAKEVLTSDDFKGRKMIWVYLTSSSFRARATSSEGPEEGSPGWELKEILGTATSLYPLYIVVGGLIACIKPSVFAWFVNRGPASYSLSLGAIMLAMGLTLELRDLMNVLLKRPFAVLFGCLAQYSIMPASGTILSRALGLPPELSVGLILLSCCPGGTASNVVTLIAQGDVPLSIVMTVCTTICAVFATPLLTKLLAGAYVPVDAGKLALSTLQVVVIPVLVGSFLQSSCPQVVNVLVPFSPLLAVLMSSLLACSVFSANIGLIKSVAGLSGRVDLAQILGGELTIILSSVLLLHAGGYIVGYFIAAIFGFGESQRRAISIEIGMQNSSLGVVLASTNFNSPLIAVPAAVSAVVMNIMGSSLAFAWKHIDLPEKGSREGNGKTLGL
uniref:Uncharacterized protein n=1 Tax=Picea sitchensis TaxID=3332 RepID=B8LQB5_PICSI|nr:unknown [Picea sitchensis]